MKLKAILLVGMASLVAAGACGGESKSNDDGNGARAGSGTGGKSDTFAGSAGTGGNTGGKAGGSGSGGKANGGNAGRGAGGSASGRGGGSGSGGSGGESGEEGGTAGDGGAQGGEAGEDESGGTGGADESGGTAGSTAGASGSAGSSGVSGSGGSGAPISVTEAAVGDLVISEIMRDPFAVDDSVGEWFEIYNASTTPIDLDGLSVSDNVGTVVVERPLTVGAHDYVVFARNSGAGNGGVTAAFTYGDELQLGNTEDVLTLSVGARVIDVVAYADLDGFPDVAGASMSFVGTPDATQNDDSSAWCAAGTRFGAGDFGTPGAAGGGCMRVAGALVAGDIVITEFMPNPDAVGDTLGEWFEVFNPTDGAVNLNGVTVGDRGTDGFPITADVYIDAGDFIVFGLGGVSTNGGVPVDYVYSGAVFTLANTTDEIVLGYENAVLDEVDYTQTFPFEAGVSASLSLGEDQIGNDSATNWCPGVTTFGLGDHGTPGQANAACP